MSSSGWMILLEAPAGTTSAGFLMSGGAETTALLVGGVLEAGSVVDDGVDDPVVLLGEDVLYAGKVGFVAVVVAVATACAAGKRGLGGAWVTGGCAGGAGCGGGISPPIMGMGAPGMPPGPMNGGAIPMAAMWWGAIGCGAPAIGWGMPGGMPGGAPKGGIPGIPAMTAGCMCPR